MDNVFHLLNNMSNDIRSDIKIHVINMKSIIKSICILDTTVRIITKSNKVIEYKFDTVRECVEYYNDIIN